MTVKRNQRRIVLIGGIAVLTAAVLSLTAEGPPRQIPTFLLLWIAPALSWSLALDGSRAERLLLGAGMALLTSALLALLLSYVPGPIRSGQTLLGAVGTTLLPLLASRSGIHVAESTAKSSWGRVLIILTILFLAAILRIVNIDYKELQGDEGVIMARAAASITGDDREIFLHQKGPVEILLPLITWSLTGTINDSWVRAPFVWAGFLAVPGIYVLARRWFTDEVGAVAGLLMAINGFAIAFSRIVQYQGLVVLWGILALLASLRYREGGRSQDLWLAFALSAAGLLAHYDAVLVLPSVAFLLISRGPNGVTEGWRPWILPLLTGSAILALFYIPYVLSPSFSHTASYLLGARVGTSSGTLPVKWSGAAAWQMMTFYNSTWYVAILLLLSIPGLLALSVKRYHLAAASYFLVPALFYLLVVGDPRTHVYTLFPGVIVLAALGTDNLWKWLDHVAPRFVCVLLTATAAGLILLCTTYVYLIFVDTDVERQRTWSENRPLPRIFPTTWAEPPEFGLFGFPHQAGWRLAPELLTAPTTLYGSNEEEEITNWYMAQAPRTYCPNFETFLLAENTQDEIAFEPEWLSEFHLQHRITVNGKTSMQIYGRAPVSQVQYHEVGKSDRWLAPGQIAAGQPDPQHRRSISLGGKVRLLGFDLDDSAAKPGGQLIVTLYWEALAQFDRNYQVFVHLYDGTKHGQDDGAPECDYNPTTHWEPGEFIADPHIVPIDNDAPSAEIPLLIGMYDLITLERLSVPDTIDDAIQLTKVEIVDH